MKSSENRNRAPTDEKDNKDSESEPVYRRYAARRTTCGNTTAPLSRSGFLSHKHWPERSPALSPQSYISSRRLKRWQEPVQCVKRKGPPTSTTMRSEAICKTLRHTDQHNRVASASNSNLIGLTSTDIASNIGCGNKQNSSTGDQEQKGQNDALPASRIKRRHPTQQSRRRQDTQNQDKPKPYDAPAVPNTEQGRLSSPFQSFIYQR